MTRPAVRRAAFAAVSILLCLASARCGGGGAATAAGGGMVPGSTCIDFVPVAGGPVSGGVVLQKNAGASSCNLVAVDVVVQNVSDVHAAAFRLRYRTAGSTLVSYMAHELRDETILDSGGVSVIVQQVETSPGLLDVGITRQPGNPCAGPNGVVVGATPQIVARLLFTQNSQSVPGTSALSFESPAPELRDSQCPPQVIPTGSPWPAGSLVVQ